MKTKLQTLVAVFSIVFVMARAWAQLPVPIDPQTGLPEPAPPPIDPATGLPLDGSPPFKDTNGVSTWINPSWKDPASIVISVNFLGHSLSDVVNQLQARFSNSFDIILPNNSTMAVNMAGKGLCIITFDPTRLYIELQLNNVTASEIFNAMNTQFELDRSPLRWELTLNGSRPTAILRNLPQLGPLAPSEPPPLPQIRKVFYVGDILGDYPGTNDAAKLASIETNILSCATGKGVVSVWGGRPRSGVKIAEYPPGQLLIVSGTSDEVDLAEQTLLALKDKAAYDKTQSPMKSQ